MAVDMPIDNLTKKLKNEDPAQFQTLVRMHLSFVLDLNTEETDGLGGKAKPKPLKWGLVSFSKKIKGPSKEVAEGIPLTKNLIAQIYELIEFLAKEENVTQEGIFRRSGKMTRQQELKSLMTQGGKFDLEDGSYSVHDVATVLKGFLSELPEPLLTEAYYPAYCQIADLYQNKSFTDAKLLRSLQLLFMLLPNENRRILKAILKLLYLTASHAGTNRMSAENLATLFTPHLLCPRKLTPEVFHTTAQNLSCIVVFMVKEGLSVFEVPQSLATDVKAYWDSKNCNLLEKSISEGPAAKTVFTFVDRERTAKENNVNPTETALAQLYAHIQGLPESNKKKKLIKQFNKENGQGTPRTKSLGDSIKKHIFCKNQSAKLKYFAEFAHLKNNLNSSEEFFNTPEKKQQRTPMPLKMRLNFGSGGEERKSESSAEDTPDGGRKTPPLRNEGNVYDDEIFCTPAAPSRVSRTTPELLTSTPAVGLTTPTPVVPLDDMSPITMSAQRMPRAMQEAMITPRSRKPVIALSGSNLINSGWTAKNISWENQDEMKQLSMNLNQEDEREGTEESLTSPFRDYLFSRSVLTASPVDLSFSSRTGDYDPSTSGEAAAEESEDTKPLTESLLFFLDGGSPPSSTVSSGSRHKRDRSEIDDEHEKSNSKRSELDTSSDASQNFVTETSL